MDDEQDTRIKELVENLSLWTYRAESAKRAGNLILLKKALRQKRRAEIQIIRHREFMKKTKQAIASSPAFPCLFCHCETYTPLPGFMNGKLLSDHFTPTVEMVRDAIKALNFDTKLFLERDPLNGDSTLCEEHSAVWKLWYGALSKAAEST